MIYQKKSLKFLELVPSTFKTYYDFEVEKASKGYGMADFVIEKVIGQCENFISGIDNNVNSANFGEFIVIDKVNGTPKEYPRKAGTPSKNPIQIICKKIRLLKI